MSAPKNTVSKLVASTLKCFLCRKYLSVPPIFVTPDGFHCGRCVSSSENPKDAVRAAPYENLAKMLLFPCQYDCFGCDVFSSFRETKNHEQKCKFKTIKCPIIVCQAIIKICDVVFHFQHFHNGAIVSGDGFSIAEEEGPAARLILLENQIYLLETFINPEKELFVDLKSLEATPAEAYYQLEVKGKTYSDMKIVKQQKFSEYSSDNFLRNNLISLKLRDIKTTLLTEHLIYQIKLATVKPTEPIPGPNDSLLVELECLVCQEYMTPPIYICKTGHSICSTCKNKLQQCPVCKAVYEGSRNFSLENLSKRIQFPCKNQSKGCIFTGTSNDVPVHMLECPFSKTTNCPLEIQESCKWVGFCHDIQDHARIEHPLQTGILIGEKIHRNLKVAPKQEFHLAFHDNNTFKICIKHDNNNGPVFWAVQHVELPPKTKPKYWYQLDFIDATGKGRVFCINALCYTSKNLDENQIFTQSIKIPTNLLAPFINGDTLLYVINISHV